MRTYKPDGTEFSLLSGESSTSSIVGYRWLGRRVSLPLPSFPTPALRTRCPDPTSRRRRWMSVIELQIHDGESLDVLSSRPRTRKFVRIEARFVAINNGTFGFSTINILVSSVTTFHPVTTSRLNPDTFVFRTILSLIIPTTVRDISIAPGQRKSRDWFFFFFFVCASCSSRPPKKQTGKGVVAVVSVYLDSRPYSVGGPRQAFDASNSGCLPLGVKESSIPR